MPCGLVPVMNAVTERVGYAVAPVVARSHAVVRGVIHYAAGSIDLRSRTTLKNPRCTSADPVGHLFWPK